MPQSQPKPFMREKTMWIVIVLLALTLLLVIFTQVEQNQQLRRVYRQQPASMGRNWESARPVDAPAMNEMGPADGMEAPLFVSETGRNAFGPHTSPDGQWMIQLIETGAPESTIEHRLILKGLKGQPSRVLVTQSETAKTEKPEEPGTHRWHLAGWSKDGKSVYVASETVYGYGTDGMPTRTYGSELWEIAVESGVMKKSFATPVGDALFGNGLVDVSSVQNQALSLLEGKLFLSDVKGGSRREVKVPRQTAGDAWQAFVLHPAGTHVAVLFQRFPGDAEPGVKPLETRAGLFNLKTAKYQDLGVVSASSFAWKDEKTLVMVGENGQQEQREVVLP